MPSHLAFTDSLKHVERRAFYDQHQTLAVTMICIVLLLPIVGLLLSGPSGVISGALLSFLAYYLAPYVSFKLGV